MLLYYSSRPSSYFSPAGKLWPDIPVGFNLPIGLNWDRVNGRSVGTVLTRTFTEPTVVENFTDTGNSVTNFNNLQALIDSLASTHTKKKIVIPAGTVIEGNLVNKVNNGSDLLVLEVAGYTRPTSPPRSATGLFTLISPNTNPAFRTITTGGVTNNHGNVAIRGAEITFSSSIGLAADTGPTAIVRFGDGTSVQNSITEQPDGFILAGCWIHGYDDRFCRRGLEWHGSNVFVDMCFISKIHNKKPPAGGGDSQGIWGWNGSGPLFVRDTIIEDADESFGTGGAACHTAIPSDQHYLRVRTIKPDSMATLGWGCKNHAEWKFGKRVLIEQCIHEGFPLFYDNAQQTVYIPKCSNEPGSTVTAITEDIISINCASNRVPQMLGLITDLGTNHPTRIAVINFMGREMNESPNDAPINAPVLQWSTGSPRDIYLDHILCVTRTGEDNSGALRFLGGTMTNFTFINSLVEANGTCPGGVGGIWDGSQGNTTLANQCAGTIDIDKVHFIGVGSVAVQPTQISNYPTGCMGYTNYAGVQFTNASGLDYSLTVSSPARNAARDGTDIGVHDYAAHLARQAEVPS